MSIHSPWLAAAHYNYKKIALLMPPSPHVALADINEVMDELKDVLACYEGIGGRLNIPNDKLEEIRGQNLRAAAAMRRVIVEWLNRNYPNSSSKPPTWKALVDAIEHPVGGNNKAEAEEIASRHRTGKSVAVCFQSTFKNTIISSTWSIRDGCPMVPI